MIATDVGDFRSSALLLLERAEQPRLQVEEKTMSTAVIHAGNAHKNPQSVLRAARLGFSLALAIIGGPPSRFAAFSQPFAGALARLRRDPLPVAVHSPGHVAPTDEQAYDEFWPRWRETVALVSEERGFAIPMEDSFRADTGPRGALYVGSPKTVAQKIAVNLRVLDANRFDLKYGMPGRTHESLMRNIELYGQRVAPRVRELVA